MDINKAEGKGESDRVPASKGIKSEGMEEVSVEQAERLMVELERFVDAGIISGETYDNIRRRVEMKLEVEKNLRRGVVFITPNNEYYRNKNLGFGWAITHETKTELTWGEDVKEEQTKTVGERIDEYLEEYKAADEFHRNVLGGIAGAEAYKWEQIFKGIQKIDEEEKEERAKKEEVDFQIPEEDLG